MTVETLLAGIGYLGRRVADALGPGVIGLGRPQYDLDVGGPLPFTLPPDYRVLYTVPPAPTSDRDERLERLLSRLAPAPRRFVYISTTGVYGDHRGARVDEDTPPAPGSDHAARRVAAERLLQDWAADQDCGLVILRVPGIYGPGRLGIERIRDRAPIVREQDAGPGNRIHVDDLAACCIAALGDKAPAGIYNVGDGDHRSSAWFSNEVARQAGLPAPPQITMAEAEQVFTAMRLSFLRDQRRVDTKKMRDTLRVTPRYANAEQGIAASLDV